MTTALAPRPAPAGTPAGGAGDDDVLHIVGDLEHWLGVLLRRVPRALCGYLLIADPNRPDHPRPDAPVCPVCAELDKRR